MTIVSPTGFSGKSTLSMCRPVVTSFHGHLMLSATMDVLGDCMDWTFDQLTLLYSITKGSFFKKMPNPDLITEESALFDLRLSSRLVILMHKY